MFCLYQDLKRYVPSRPDTGPITRLLLHIVTMLIHPGWLAVFNFRLAQGLRKIWLHPLSWLIYRINMHLFSIDIHPMIKIGPGLWMPHPFAIVMARDSQIGRNATVYQNVTVGGRANPSVIGDNVVLGAGACVLGPAIVGDNVTVGANTVVTKDVSPGATVIGSPFRNLDKSKNDGKESQK